MFWNILHGAFINKQMFWRDADMHIIVLSKTRISILRIQIWKYLLDLPRFSKKNPKYFNDVENKNTLVIMSNSIIQL